MADGTSIFMVNAPGQYNLVKNVRHLHTDPDGILSAAVAGDDGFLHIEENAGPGQELRTYLPKQMSLGEKLRETLTPSEASQACCTLLRMKEKRMDADKWQLEGRHQHGSHYPLAIFGCNAGQRSSEAKARRQANANEKRANRAASRGSGGAPEAAVATGGAPAVAGSAGLSKSRPVGPTPGPPALAEPAVVRRPGTPPVGLPLSVPPVADCVADSSVAGSSAAGSWRHPAWTNFVGTAVAAVERRHSTNRPYRFVWRDDRGGAGWEERWRNPDTGAQWRSSWHTDRVDESWWTGHHAWAPR